MKAIAREVSSLFIIIVTLAARLATCHLPIDRCKLYCSDANSLLLPVVVLVFFSSFPFFSSDVLYATAAIVSMCAMDGNSDGLAVANEHTHKNKPNHLFVQFSLGFVKMANGETEGEKHTSTCKIKCTQKKQATKRCAQSKMI